MSNKTVKRSRQLTLAESFKNFRRRDIESMDIDEKQQNDKRELLATAAEKRIAQEVPAVKSFERWIDLDGPECEIPETQSLEEELSEELFAEAESQEEIVQIAEEDSNSEPQGFILNRLPECSVDLPAMSPSSSHEIMFRPHILDGVPPRPYPENYRDCWDTLHVRMPCSPRNLYPIYSENGEKSIENRWNLINETLNTDMLTSQQLECSVMKYNRQYSGRWDFRGLHIFFTQCMKPAQKSFFFDAILPNIVQLALDLPHICTQPIPLLKKHKDHSISLSQKQIGSVLANAFLCTFPRRNLPPKHSNFRSNEYNSYPDINFNRLFVGTKEGGISSTTAEKLKCLFNYFLRVTTKDPCGVVTFHRRCLKQSPKWETLKTQLKPVVVQSTGFIETEGWGMLQVDFANKFVGGGVLMHGCVQEEIRFMICPELIVSRLFTECLDDNEALIITGVEQYNTYKGYGNTFTWESDFEDSTASDAWGRKYTQVVAIDALHFSNTRDQFKLTAIRRELNKAYTGFSSDSENHDNLAAVATGNWGCGAFRGDPHLKFLVQLVACSQAGRGMSYFTFGSKKLKDDFEKIYCFLTEKQQTVGDIWNILVKYSTSASETQRASLYEYMYKNVNSTSSKETTVENDDIAILPDSIFENEIAATDKDWPEFFD